MIIQNFDTNYKVLIVAEIGNNHEGNFTIASTLVKEAAKAGASAVKFQSFQTESFINMSDNERFERFKRFELTIPQFRALSDLAHSFGLLFISTPLDLNSARELADFVDAYKIASGDVNFYPLIKEIVKTGKPIIISTGASDYSQVSNTVSFIGKELEKNNITPNLGILHCTSCYPTPIDQVNLLSIPFLKEKFSHTIGYSDHTLGIHASLIAVSLGARIIEKHFTLSHSFSSFRDHQLSAEPEEMKELTHLIPHVVSMIGIKEKCVQPCESEIDVAIRRSIVAIRDLPSGHIIGYEDLGWIRPATGGLSPGEEHLIVNRILKRSLAHNEQIRLQDLH
ncbi:N-acetylneuraminate synthase family protein [Methanocalculus sp. MC3]